MYLKKENGLIIFQIDIMNEAIAIDEKGNISIHNHPSYCVNFNPIEFIEMMKEHLNEFNEDDDFQLANEFIKLFESNHNNENLKCLFDKHIVCEKANEILSFCGALLAFKKGYVNTTDFLRTRNMAAIDLINQTIIPTVGSESDITYWKQIIWEIENMGDAKYIEYDEPEALEPEDEIEEDKSCFGTIEWSNGNTENIRFSSYQNMRLQAEDNECVQMYLDDLGAPLVDENGETYSIVGRIMSILKTKDNRTENEKRFYETDLKIRAFELAQKLPAIVDSSDITNISKEYIEASKKIFDFIK